MEESEDNSEKLDIEKVLTDIGVGKFHIINYLFIGITITVTNMNVSSFIFTARDTSYRCLIPECDTVPKEFNQIWLDKAIPHTDNLPQKCLRYAVSNTSAYDENIVNGCKVNFDNRTKEICTSWVYGEGDSIVKEFNIPCEDWKRSLVGTMNGVGQLVSLLFSGILSDKYGRRNVMIIMTSASGIIGLIQSFSPNYWFFVIFEFLNLTVSAGAYTSAYILGLEILSSKNRVMGSILISALCACAICLLGIVAWIIHSWKWLLIASNVPGLFVLFAFFAIPESVRWLNAKGKFSECEKVIRQAAKLNGVKFPDENMLDFNKMVNKSINIEDRIQKIKLIQNDHKSEKLKNLFKSPRLFRRLIICAFCWFANVFAYFGLSLNSVAISGDEKHVYLNYILSTIVEFPSIILYGVLLRWSGRKKPLALTLFLCGVSCILYGVIPNLPDKAGLSLYLMGKLFISSSFLFVYIYTTEIFPTSVRNSALNFCSVVGRIGGILAPQVPLLYKFFPGLPMITFGVIPIISALTLINLPESKGKTLPDSIQDAENL